MGINNRVNQNRNIYLRFKRAVNCCCGLLTSIDKIEYLSSINDWILRVFIKFSVVKMRQIGDKGIYLIVLLFIS